MIERRATDPPRPRTWEEVVDLAQYDRRWRFGRRLLDVRAAGDHVPGTASLPVARRVPWHRGLPSYLLGDRTGELVVLAEAAERARDAATHLRARGWLADYLDGEVPTRARQPGLSDGELWRPDPFLVDVLPLLPPPSAGAVVDLGAGSGRDSCFLASLGYNCLLVDRYPDVLELARARARRLGVDIRTRRQDLRGPEPVPGTYACALSIRFLIRERLVRAERMLRPGGMLLLHTLAPSPRAQDPGHAADRYRLSVAEFHACFPPPTWETCRGPEIEPRREETWIRGLVRRRADA